MFLLESAECIEYEAGFVGNGAFEWKFGIKFEKSTLFEVAIEFFCNVLTVVFFLFNVMIKETVSIGTDIITSAVDVIVSTYSFVESFGERRPSGVTLLHELLLKIKNQSEKMGHFSR